MSPRRRIEPGSLELLRVPERPPRRRGLPVVAAVSGVLLAGAIAASTFVLVNHESYRRAEVRDASVLTFVSSFVTEFTSLDPLNANDYTDRLLAQGTGEFARVYRENLNALLIQIARSEPSRGAVEALGIERWNDDGSADVVVAAKTTSKTPDGKTVESGSRWVVTAIKEGQLWKISRMTQVI